VRKLRDGTDDERQRYAARAGRIIWRILMPKKQTHYEEVRTEDV